jgi:hypothetical protein
VAVKKSSFESVSILVKGGWKEAQGVQRPILAETPVSESRMASLNPFETKRKRALTGASSRVRDVQVAEGMGLRSYLLQILCVISEHKDTSTRLPDPISLNKPDFAQGVGGAIGACAVHFIDVPSRMIT